MFTVGESQQNSLVVRRIVLNKVFYEWNLNVSCKSFLKSGMTQRLNIKSRVQDWCAHTAWSSLIHEQLTEGLIQSGWSNTDPLWSERIKTVEDQEPPTGSRNVRRRSVSLRLFFWNELVRYEKSDDRWTHERSELTNPGSWMWGRGQWGSGPEVCAVQMENRCVFVITLLLLLLSELPADPHG